MEIELNLNTNPNIQLQTVQLQTLLSEVPGGSYENIVLPCEPGYIQKVISVFVQIPAIGSGSGNHTLSLYNGNIEFGYLVSNASATKGLEMSGLIPYTSPSGGADWDVIYPTTEIGFIEAFKTQLFDSNNLFRFKYMNNNTVAQNNGERIYNVTYAQIPENMDF